MPDDPELRLMRQTTLAPDHPSERTVTVSHERLLRLLDDFTECARSLEHKLILLDDLYALLQGDADERGRRVLTKGKQRAVQQMLADLRVMRAEAEEQAD